MLDFFLFLTAEVECCQRLFMDVLQCCGKWGDLGVFYRKAKCQSSRICLPGWPCSSVANQYQPLK